MISILKNLADVQAGHAFRGSVPVSAQGNAYALQMRDVTPQGEVDWGQLTRTEVDTSKPVQWLAPGDVLFAARGTRLHAFCLKEVPGPTVCSPNFFLVRLRTSAVRPDFLAWQINRPPCQRYLASNAEGTDQLSIRRPLLESMPVAVPTLARQQSIMSLAEAAVQEARHLRSLIRNRDLQLDALAQWIASDPAPAD